MQLVSSLKVNFKHIPDLQPVVEVENAEAGMEVDVHIEIAVVNLKGEEFIDGTHNFWNRKWAIERVEDYGCVFEIFINQSKMCFGRICLGSH